MARQPRKISNTGVYHVMIRGNEKRNIFYDDEDRMHFLNIVQTKVRLTKTKLYAYCLMDNHVHFLMGEGNESMAVFMKRINVSYAYYFNKKYDRIGHLFQDRFRSEVIEDDRYLLEAMRYIHNNPVKASIVNKTEDYKWSSYHYFIVDLDSSIEKYFLLNMFSDNIERALELFKEFHLKNDEREFLNCDTRNKEEKRIRQVKKAKEIIDNVLNQNNFTDENYLDHKDMRNKIILSLKQQRGLSIRQIADVLNINRGVVQIVITSDKKNHLRGHEQ